MGIKKRSKSAALATFLAMALLVQQFAQDEGTATAGIYEEVSATSYQEVWIPHSSYTGRLLTEADTDNGDGENYDPGGGTCQFNFPSGGAYYTEPETGCDSSLAFTLPSNLTSASKVEMFLDLWRAHDNSGTIQYRFNNDSFWTTVSPGEDWSRTSQLIEIDISRLDNGSNTMHVRAKNANRKFHIHDAAFRIYGLTGSYPTGAGLTNVNVNAADIDPATGGLLDVSAGELVTLTAEVAGAEAVEFIAYYDGFDEDNNGLTTDWHSFNHNNCNDGTGSNVGIRPTNCTRTFGETDPVSATMGHLGTDLDLDEDGIFTVTWDTSLVSSQTGIKFKVRAIDTGGSKREVVDALGGESAEFELYRENETVEYFTIPGFGNAGLCQGFEDKLDPGDPDVCKLPESYAVTLTLPDDISGFTSATLLHNFWQAPFVQVNSGTNRVAFDGSTSIWTTSVLDIPLGELQAGDNTITYRYNDARISYGQFIENPGPMLVIRRPNTPRIVTQPQSRAAVAFQPVSFSVVASGSGLTYQWYEGGIVMGGETTSTLDVIASNTPGDTVYSVEVTAGGETIESDDAILTVVDAPITSDQFDSTVKSGFWTEFSQTGAGDFFYTGEQLIISVPESATSLQPWTSGNLAPTLAQDALNTDMDIIVGIENVPAKRYQLAGLIVAGAGNEFLRFDLYHDGTELRLHRARLDGSTVTSALSEIVTRPDNGILHLRVNRTGDDWHLFTSSDGSTWNHSNTLDFTSAIVVDQVGPFAGNAKNGALAPAYSAVFDYFFAKLSDTEGAENDIADPVISNEDVIVGPSAFTVSWETAEPTVSHIEWGLPGEDYPNDEGTGQLGRSNSAIISGLGFDTLYDLRITAIDHNGREVVSEFSATTSSAGSGATTFDVWYGDSQSFGLMGNPQRWINIVGNVSDSQGIDKLEYKIGEGPYTDLSIGPDDRRLPGTGDFNIDILGPDLEAGFYTVTLRATDGQTNMTEYDVQVQWGDTAVWEMPYAIDWSGLTAPTDGAQIVDGNWVLEGDTLTLGNLDVGYDRLAVLGDVTWESYEALVPFTVNGIHEDADDPASFGPGIGVMMHWNGHNDTKDASAQPLIGFVQNGDADPTPLGSILWWRDPKSGGGRLQITDHYGAEAEKDESFTLVDNTEYMLRTRAIVGASGVTYSMKMWKSSDEEPADWSLVYVAGTDDFEPQSGALILVSHEVDASYGNVIVTPAGDSAVEAPDFSVASGIVDVDDEIALSTTTPDATIYYTVDGSEPTPLSSKYSGPFTATADITIKAIAYADNFDPSDITAATYTVNFAPEVTTGAAVTVELGDEATLSATVDDDGVTAGVTQLWSKVSGPGNIAFTSATSTSTQATFSVKGTYVVKLVANDGRLGGEATLSIVVTETVIPSSESGYWMLEGAGKLWGFGDATNFADVDLAPGVAAVAFDRSSDGKALWILDSSGKIHVRGTAAHKGDVPASGLASNDRVATIAATPSGNGYWVFTDLGKAFNFGDADHFNDLPGLGIVPNGPVVASAPTPSGNGYYMLGSDGGVFAFGDAVFSGSIPGVLPGVTLACPIVGLVPVPSGVGYWLVACDGGVFAFGDAFFVGSLPGVLAPGTVLNQPVNGMVAYADGYLMVAADGGVFNFSTTEFLGSLGGIPLDSPIVAIAAFTA